MKAFLCYALSAVLILFMSCTNGEYKPIEGYNGKVKRLVTYSYKTSFDKNRMVSQYGSLIPNKIEEYSKQGMLERKIEITLPDEDVDNAICVIEVDSILYNRELKVTSSVKYTIYVSPEDVVLYNEPEKLITSNKTFTIKNESTTSYGIKGNKKYESTITNVYYDLSKLSKLPTAFGSHIEYLEYYSMGLSKSDTLKCEYVYENDKIIRKVAYHTSINDSITTTYTYKDGMLWEENDGGYIKRFDNKGREIYSKFNTHETITTYKDTTAISLSTSEYGKTISLEMVNRDSLIIMSASIDIDNRDSYEDEAVMLLERFRDEKISQMEFEKDVESLVSKIDESDWNSIETLSYSNYDVFNNPLNIVKNKIIMINKYAHIPSESLKYILDRGVLKNRYTYITEKEIEYYE